MENVTDYHKLINHISRLTRRGWRSETIGEADGYPLYVLTNTLSPAPDVRVPDVLICAGIHGEEPAAVHGLFRWLFQCADAWMQRIRMTVFPCLNPWGYERGIRYSADGDDLNRQFDAPFHPAVQAFHRYVADKTFDLFVDLHEDCDFTRMYLYEVLTDSLKHQHDLTLGRRILNRVRPAVELANDEMADDMEIKDGMIYVPLTRKEARDFTQTPVALYVYGHHAPHVVTVETPGLLPLDRRANLHGEALEEACTYVTSLKA